MQAAPRMMYAFEAPRQGRYSVGDQQSQDLPFSGTARPPQRVDGGGVVSESGRRGMPPRDKALFRSNTRRIARESNAVLGWQGRRTPKPIMPPSSKGKALELRSHGESMAPAAQVSPHARSLCRRGQRARAATCCSRVQRPVSTAVLRDRSLSVPTRFHTDPDNRITETDSRAASESIEKSRRSRSDPLGSFRKTAGNGLFCQRAKYV